MARRKARKSNAGLIIACFALMILIVAYEAIAHIAIYAALTAALCAGAYAIGRYQSRIPARKLAANARYGKAPRASVTSVNAVSAYPADAVTAVVRDQAADGLANLGWPKSQTRGAITSALAAVAKREPVTTKAVITEVLRMKGSTGP